MALWPADPARRLWPRAAYGHGLSRQGMCSRSLSGIHLILHAGYVLAQPRGWRAQDMCLRGLEEDFSCTQDTRLRSLVDGPVAPRIRIRATQRAAPLARRTVFTQQNARRIRAAQPSGRPILPAGYVVAQLRGRPILHRGYVFAQPRGRPSHYILYMRNLRALTPLCIIARLNHLNICAYAAHKSNIALLR